MCQHTLTILLLLLATTVSAQLSPKPGPWHWQDGDWHSEVDWHSDGTYTRKRDESYRGKWRTKNDGLEIGIEWEGKERFVPTEPESTSTRLVLQPEPGRWIVFSQDNPTDRKLTTAIQGTWLYTTPEGQLQEKSFMGDKWLCTVRSPTSNLLTWWHGGSYRLELGNYFEVCDYCTDNDAGLVGTESVFRLELQGNHLIQHFPDSDHREDYWSAPTQRKLPTTLLRPDIAKSIISAYAILGTPEQPAKLTSDRLDSLDLRADGTFHWQRTFNSRNNFQGNWNVSLNAKGDTLLNLLVSHTASPDRPVGLMTQYRVSTATEIELTLHSQDGLGTHLLKRLETPSKP